MSYVDNISELNELFELRTSPTDKDAKFPVYFCLKCGGKANFTEEAMFPCQENAVIPIKVTCGNKGCRNRWKLEITPDGNTVQIPVTIQ